MVVGLATPALAAIAIDQAIEGRIGWGFYLLAAALASSWLIGVGARPTATRFNLAVGRSLMRRSVGHALDIGLPGRRPFNDGDLLLRAASLALYIPSYATVMLRVGTGLVMAIGSLVALFAIHWLFALVLLVVVGALFFLARRLVAVLTAEQSEYETLNASMVTPTRTRWPVAAASAPPARWSARSTVATAARVFAALRSLSAAHTTVVIAHRASTAAAADVVAWIVDGRIERLAPHGELWRDAAYRSAFVAVGAEESREMVE